MKKKIIACLGNPGKKYARTRHNAGVLFIEYIYPDLVWNERGDLLIAEKIFAEGGLEIEAIFLFPQTYMNNSGIPLKQFAAKKGIPLENLIICHDELDLPLGDVRLKQGGGEAGHNGLKSISQNFGTKDYARIRIGIGKPPPGMEDRGNLVVDWVLSNFSKSELEVLEPSFNRAADLLASWVKA